MYTTPMDVFLYVSTMSTYATLSLCTTMYNIYFVSLQCIYLNCTLTTMSASIRADPTNKYYL